jgi:hypothetical protein
MLSFELLRVIVEDREREVQGQLRVRRLLEPHDPAPDDTTRIGDERDGTYPDPWRARTPRASATTR